MNISDQTQPYSCTHFFAGLNLRVHGALYFAGAPLMLDGKRVGAAFKTATHSITCIFEKQYRGDISQLRITKGDIALRDNAVHITPKRAARHLRSVA